MFLVANQKRIDGCWVSGVANQKQIDGCLVSGVANQKQIGGCWVSGVVNQKQIKEKPPVHTLLRSVRHGHKKRAGEEKPNAFSSPALSMIRF